MLLTILLPKWLDDINKQLIFIMNPKNIFLIIGAILIVGVTVFTLNYLNDLNKEPSQERENSRELVIEVYKKYLKSIHNNDKEQFKNLSYKGEWQGKGIDTNSEEFDKMWEYLQQAQPEVDEIQIANVVIEKNNAVLRTQSKTDNPEERMYGLIKLKKDKDGWKIFKSRWEKPVSLDTLINKDSAIEYEIEYWNIFTFCNKISLEECLKQNDAEYQNSGFTHPCVTCVATRDAKPELCQKEKGKMPSAWVMDDVFGPILSKKGKAKEWNKINMNSKYEMVLNFLFIANEGEKCM